MKRYLKNLLSALLGNNPYQTEHDELRRQMEQASENVEQLRNMYCAACEKCEQGDKQVASLQQLVENLRERIAIKDTAIEQYIIEVDALRGELQIAQGKELSF